MIVSRFDRMKLENNIMFAIVQGNYTQVKAHTELVMKEQGYGNHLHDFPKERIFVYGKEAEFIEPAYMAAKDSIRVALRFYELRDGTTRIEMMNASRISGLDNIVDKDMPGLVQALSYK